MAAEAMRHSTEGRSVDRRSKFVSRHGWHGTRPPATLHAMVLDEVNRKEEIMKKLFAYGGIAASVVLIVFGAGSIGLGAWGVNQVRDDLAREQIVGGDDEVFQAHGIAGARIDTGSEAKQFAAVMREHTLAATDGQTYATIGRYLDEKGNPTSDVTKAEIGANGQPVENPLRQLWVTETALSTALNTAFFAERVAVFSIIMGFALLLTGIGFLVITLGGALGVAPLPRRRSARSGAPATTS